MFNELKKQFTEATILAMPNLSRPFTLEADTSDYVIGVVLSQKGGDEHLHPVAFYLKPLNNTKRNYEIHDKELLAVQALDEGRHYLEGSEHKINIVSDHKNLKYFLLTKTLMCRQG